MKLVVEILSAEGDVAAHKTLERFPASVGRAYDNDIIFPDAHVSPHHARIERDGEGFILRDLSSENGCEVNGHAARERRLNSGDRIRLGHSVFRIYDPAHPVLPAIKIQKTPALLGRLSHPLVIWLLFCLSIATAILWAWLEVWTEEAGRLMAAAGGGTAAILLLWAAPWSLAGRLSRHRARFATHIALGSLYVIVSALLWYAQIYVSFLANDNLFSLATDYLCNYILLAPLLYGSLSIATRLSERQKRRTALAFPAGMLAVVFVISLVSQKNFSRQPSYPTTLKPYLSALAPVTAIDDFMQENQMLFGSKKLNPPKR